MMRLVWKCIENVPDLNSDTLLCWFALKYMFLEGLSGAQCENFYLSLQWDIDLGCLDT